MSESNAPPIIIKRIKKSGGGGHHGGAWKVAYADFVTAMMAFFLLLWLLNVTTDVQKKGIADYFTPSSVSRTESGSGGVLGGKTLVVEGSRISENGVPSVTLTISPTNNNSDSEQTGKGPETEEDFEKKKAEREQKAFEETEKALKAAIENTAELAELKRNLLVDMTPEGLRIQIVDQQNQSMFPSGSASMHERTRLLLQKVSQVIDKLPNRVSISGHTDATQFRAQNGYGNWELSADRANASRRVLMDMGLSAQRITQVVGKAEQEPLYANDRANPSNRRISIVLLRESNAKP